MQRNVYDWFAFILLVIGGINTGIIGLFNYDLIIDIFASNLLIAHSLFLLIGIAAIYAIVRVWLSMSIKKEI